MGSNTCETEAAKCPRSKRTVKFEEDSKLVSAVFRPREPWADVEPLGPYELVGAYKLRCDSERLPPLYSVLNQLQTINLRESYVRRPCFCLKGIQLNESQVEVLEEVFKRVQFELLNLENSNLNDDTVISLCEMIEFYESCTELCLARNPKIHKRGWNALSLLIRRLPCLRWIDMRDAVLGDPDVFSLACAIRLQSVACRSEIARYLKSQTAKLNLHSGDTESNTTDCPSTACLTHQAIHCLERVPHRDHIGVLGLHLGSTGIRNGSLSRLINSVRLSAIRDLRLPNNRLDSADASSLVPLLRYSATLQYLDLSKNNLGDEGCAEIANALASTSFPTQATSSPNVGLIRLDLSGNGLTNSSMVALANALPHCTRLTCLRLSGNSLIACSGVSSLQPGLIRCRSLRRLGLSGCNISCIGAVALAEVLIDKPRCLKALDLRCNPIGAAGLLALARSVNFVDRHLQFIGFGRTSSDTRMLSAIILSEHGGVSNFPTVKPDPGLPCLSIREAMDELLNRLEDNHVQFPSTRLNRSSRYCDITCPSLPPDQPTSSTAFRCSHEDVDPRYFWGDSSDEDDVPCSISSVFGLDPIQADCSTTCSESKPVRTCSGTHAAVSNPSDSGLSSELSPTNSSLPGRSSPPP